jgi:DNA-binding NarL/FixJ family response regulator
MKKGEVILIVDDNMNFVDRIIGLLEEVEGVGDIIVASDFEEARSMLAQEEPCIILLDINLPGKNGIELLKLIKQMRPECEVIMITNHADDYYRSQCYELGAKHFLDKSNDFDRVPAIVRQRINSKKL